MIRTATTLPFAALLLGACAGTPATPQTYEEWVDSLPETAGFTPYHADMSMDMSFDVEAMAAGLGGVEFEQQGDPVDMIMKARMTGALDYAAPDRLHGEMEMLMDFGAMADAGAPTSMEFAMHIVADGEMLWLDPDWRSNWLADAMESGGGGFADMVFTAKISTLVRLGESYGRMMEVVAPEMFTETSYLEMARASMDIAAWPRTFQEWFAEVRSFEVVDDEVHIVFALSEDYLDMMKAFGQAELDFMGLDGVEYFMTADLRTGVPRTLLCHMGGALGMDMRVTFETRDPAAWPDDHFRFVPPTGRERFPIDVYLDMIGSMVALGDNSAEQDLEF